MTLAENWMRLLIFWFSARAKDCWLYPVLGIIQSLRVSVNENRALVPLPVEPSMVTLLVHVTPVSKSPVYQSSA